MPVKLDESHDSKVMEVQTSGKIAHDDYQRLVPKLEELLERRGRVRVLFEMADFHGSEESALWHDLKFNAKHFSNIERIAMVADRK